MAIVLLAALPVGLQAAEGGSPMATDDTMLLFVGEQTEILSIASRREESASRAPAVAQVISRDEFQNHGLSTMSQVLERTPGFFMAQKEWGTLPSLRGMPNSVLFLYDTVPVDSDVRKSVHQLDHDLSLAPVKKIEVIRGPASVLWGPDAFGGVVNVVPLTGGDVDGLEAGVLGGAGETERGSLYINAGKETADWDGFVSLSGLAADQQQKDATVLRFFGDNVESPVPSDERFGSRSIESSHSLEAYGRLAYKDWLTISGRYSENEKPYAIADPDTELYWREQRSLPFSYLKAEASKKLGTDTVLRFTGYFSALSSEFEVIDKVLKQQEQTYYGEMIYEQTLFTGKGLFTGGLSYRNKQVEDAPIWDSFLPDFLGPENDIFLPFVQLEDYQAELWSVFGQYSHKLKDFDFILGLRADFHETYEDQLSFNTGLVWHPNELWQAKLLYGTAYRTPFARQLQEEDEPDLEKIETLTAQLSWRPVQELNLAVTGFWSGIDDHVIEDAFAGLSEKNSQDIYGLELQGSYSPRSDVRLSANLTWLDNQGSDERFVFEEFSFIRPDGTEETTIQEFSLPYNAGPDTIFNLTLDWWPMKDLLTSLHLNYISSRELTFPKGEKIESASGRWRLDASVTCQDLGLDDLDLTLSARNVLDDDFETPGTYAMIDGDDFQVALELRYHFGHF
jgi:outer membrane receptor for ferrienterochelin and colicin